MHVLGLYVYPALTLPSLQAIAFSLRPHLLPKKEQNFKGGGGTYSNGVGELSYTGNRGGGEGFSYLVFCFSGSGLELRLDLNPANIMWTATTENVNFVSLSIVFKNIFLTLLNSLYYYFSNTGALQAVQCSHTDKSLLAIFENGHIVFF